MANALNQLAGPVVVAGHACLDLIPRLIGPIPPPGGLTEIDGTTLACGGAVPNVGGALRRLGAPVRMIARIGDDLFGRTIAELLGRTGADLRLRIVQGEASSHSIVLAPGRADRSFLHAPAVNHTFDPEVDVTDDDLAGAVALHLGYPPSMRRTYADGGASLARLMQRAQGRGMVTSLDTNAPDLSGPAGAVDWNAWFARVLPHVSFFCPSEPELRALTGRSGDPATLARRMVDAGAAVVVLKRGERGLRIISTPDGSRLKAAGLGRDWIGLDLVVPCFAARFVSATGSGDCTIAGLLAAVVSGMAPQEAARMACAVGAFSVEHETAIGGVGSWTAVLERLGAGWPTVPTDDS